MISKGGALLILFCLKICLSQVRAQSDSLYILFIGNSFTNGADMPSIVEEMALTAGLPVSVSSYTKNGQSVSYFSKDAGCYNKIKSRDWDFIVFQDYQAFYYGPYGSFDSAGVDIYLLAKNIQFQDSIKKLQPCAKLIYFAGWEKRGGRPDLYPGDNTEGLINRILGNYAYLNMQPGVNNGMAPVGAAWIRSMAKRPDIDLYVGDNRHPSYAGSFLTASVFVAVLFRIDPTGVEFTGGLSEDKARHLRSTAHETFLDSLGYANVNGFHALLEAKNNELRSDPGYVRYEWYRDGAFMATTQAESIRIESSGKYSVVIYDAQGCGTRSVNLTVIYQPDTGENSVIIPATPLLPALYPNPTSGQVYMANDHSMYWSEEIRVYNMKGSLVQVYKKTAGWRNVDLSDLPEGMYTLEMQKKQERLVLKVLVVK